MTDYPKPPFEQPRSEPEIIPPGATSRARFETPFERIDLSQRIYVTKIGPIGIILIALAVGIVFAAVLILVLGAFLVWIPVVGLLVAAGVVSTLFRNYLRRRQ
jgi:hypothetical protein